MQCFERVVALHAVKNLKFLPGIDHLVTGVLYVDAKPMFFCRATMEPLLEHTVTRSSVTSRTQRHNRHGALLLPGRKNATRRVASR